MSLPTGGPWPPPPQGQAFTRQSLWSAWAEGDPEKLAAAYLFTDPGGSNPFGEQQRAGGLIPAIARAFWSRPSATGVRKAKLHVPLAGDICTASADLCFSEPPQFVIAKGGNEAAKKRADAVLNTGDFHSSLLEAAEITAALGGAWLRLIWDTDLTGHVIVDAVPADAAYAEWRLGVTQPTAVTFFSEYPGNGKSEVVRHLERHEPGVIYHGLYSGDAKQLGHAMALTDHESTAPYADLVNAEGAILTGVKAITAAYVANMRPQLRWRTVGALSRLGRSDFDGVEGLMDSVDEKWTDWMRDLRLGRARLTVPGFMLQNMGRGRGQVWDEDQEIYSPLNIPPGDNAQSQITASQFAANVDGYQKTIAALTDEVLCKAGYSPSTFGSGGDGQIATATEVISRERQSARTRDKKTRYWSQALEPLLTTWLELDAAIFHTSAQGEVAVKWADVSQPDTEALARTASLLNIAEAASRKTLVAMQHPDWDEKAIAVEVLLIQQEARVLVPEPAF